MWPNPQFPADLATFTEEIFNGQLHFFVQCQCSISITIFNHHILSLQLITNATHNTGSVLTLSNLKVSDSGMYQCRVKFLELTGATNNATLSVYGKNIEFFTLVCNWTCLF